MNAMAAPGGDPKKIDYPTPQEWFDYLNLEFGFTLDPCCAHGTAKCKKYYTEEDDGLNKSWADERVFMNPPYGRHLGPWMKKAYEESKRGALVVCFVPARVDTNWWHDYAIKGEIRLPKGRVKNPGGGAWPFPVAVVIFRPRLHSLPNAKRLAHADENLNHTEK
jgi:phage N-6-adenine-methyltransferase